MSAPSDRRNFVVRVLLAIALIALVVPWPVAAAAAAALVAVASVLAALGFTWWTAGSNEPKGTGPLDWSLLLARLDRIAAALEVRPVAPAAADGLATLASAIAEGRWADAEAMLAENPDHPDAARYAGQVALAKQAAGHAMQEELRAAQEVNDPDRVLELHARLTAVLTLQALAEIEAQIVKWFVALIMRRLRGGTVRPDVAELAAKVADRFPKSVEGASLRASLATLRRSAGLCPRCARPYRGIADACPLCMTPMPAAGPNGQPADPAWSGEPPEDSELPTQSPPEGPDYPVFLDDPT